MSNEKNTSPPQYIITTPSEADTEEERSLQDLDAALEGSNSVFMEQSSSQQMQQQQHVQQHYQVQQQQQRRVVSQVSRQIASRSFSIASATTSSILEEDAITDPELQKQIQELKAQAMMQQQTQSQQQIFSSSTTSSSTQRTIASSVRSQSLQSSEQAIQIAGALSSSHTLGTTQLGQQLKAHSSTALMQKTSSTSSSSSTKSKFQSFLQQPEAVAGHPASGSGTFLTAHQKHVRQFTRSTSAHSEATAVSSGSGGRPEKCIRSASTQIDEHSSAAATMETTGNGEQQITTMTNINKLGLHQASSILISKSAETIEMKASASASQRTQLTLSGGLLAPPNRKITILSPIHAPPGLHDMLKRAGRSPLSPRISFPGSEADLFG